MGLNKNKVKSKNMSLYQNQNDRPDLVKARDKVVEGITEMHQIRTAAPEHFFITVL